MSQDKDWVLDSAKLQYSIDKLGIPSQEVMRRLCILRDARLGRKRNQPVMNYSLKELERAFKGMVQTDAKLTVCMQDCLRLYNIRTGKTSRSNKLSIAHQHAIAAKAKYEHMWLVASSADIYSNESQEEIL